MSGSGVDRETIFFMHLYLDAENQGGPLQGQQFGYTITQLSHFLEKISKGGIKDKSILRLLSAPEASPKADAPVSESLSSESKGKEAKILHSAEIDLFIKEMAFLKQFQDQINTATQLSDLKRTANQVLEHLIEKGQVDFPGGYLHSEGGHALVYRFVVDPENNRLLFLVLNSGEGLRYHQSAVNPKLTKTLYEHVLAYEVPFAKLPLARLTGDAKADAKQGEEWRSEAVAFITELLRPNAHRIEGSPRCEASNLYEQVFELIRFLGGEACDTASLSGRRLKPRYITPQRSGSCAQKSLNQLVKEHCPDKKSAVAFMLAYRLDYLPQYIQYLKKKGLDKDPEHRQYVVAAVRNLSRVLVEDLDKLRLAPDHVESIQKYLASVLEKFELPLEQKKWSPAASPPTPPASEPRPRVTFSHVLKVSGRDARRQPVDKRLVVGASGVGFAGSLAALLADPSADSAESVRALCIQLLDSKLFDPVEVKEESGAERAAGWVSEPGPVPVEVKHSGRAPAARLVSPPASASASSVSFGGLFGLFSGAAPKDEGPVLPLVQDLLKAVKCFGGQSSPQSVPMYFALMLLGLKEFDQPGLRLSGAKGLSLLDLYAYPMLSCLQEIQKIPYLASYTPESDLMLKRMERYLEQRVEAFYPRGKGDGFSMRKRVIDYYVQVIDQYPKLARQLAEKNQSSSDSEFKRKLKELSDRDPAQHPLIMQREGYVREHPGSEKLLAYLVLLTDEERLGPVYRPLTEALDQVRQYEEWMQQCFGQMIPDALTHLGSSLTLTSKRRKLKPAPSLQQINVTSLAIQAAWLSYGYNRSLQEQQIILIGTSPMERRAAYHHSILENLLGYYRLNPGLLRFEKHRVYFKLCLFQPGLLIDIFSRPAGREQEALEFLKAFVGFFEMGFAYHDKAQGEKISEAQLFLLQLATRLYGYALDPAFPAVQALAGEQLSRIEKILAPYLDQVMPKADPVLGLKLRQTKALLLIRKLAASGSLGAERKYEAKRLDSADSPLEELIRLKIQMAQCIGHMPKELKLSVDEQELTDRIDLQMCDYFKRHFEDILKHLPAIIQENYPELTIEKVEAIAGQPLVYRLILVSKEGAAPGQEYRLDLSSGILMMGDRYRKPLPAAVVAGEDYAQVIGEGVAAWFDARDSFYYFRHKGKEYRVLDGTPPALQTPIQGDWYTVAATRPETSHVEGDAPLRSFSAPLLYHQSRYRWWFKGEEAYVEDCERGCFVYRCRSKGRMLALNPDNLSQERGEVIFAPDQKLLAPFLAVESSEFIEVLKTASGYQVNLPRYGQQFEVIEKAGKFEAVCQIDGRKFKLVGGSDLDFAGFPGYMVLETVEEKAGVMPKRLVRVPWQAFMIETRGPAKEKEVEGLHYKLIQDHSHVLKRLPFDEAKSPLDKAKPPHQHWWRYNDTERMLEFSVSADGQLKAHSSADQLYLVYIYLAHRRPDLADKILRDIELLGSAEELENAFLILTQLPAGEDQLNTPANIAVQNRLLHKLAELGHRSKRPISLPVPKAATPPDDEDSYAHWHYRHLLRFYYNLDHMIARKHVEYLNTLNNIPEMYRLQHEEEHELLSYYVLGHRCLTRPFHGFQPSLVERVYLDQDELKAQEQKARDALCLETYLRQEGLRERLGAGGQHFDSLLLARWAAFQNGTLQGARSLLERKEDDEQAGVAPELKDALPASSKVLALKTKTLKFYFHRDDLSEDERKRDEKYSSSFVRVSREPVLSALFPETPSVTVKSSPKLSLALTEEELAKHLASYYHRLLDEKESELRASTQAFCERALAYCAVLPEADKERNKLAYFHFLLTVARNPRAFKRLDRSQASRAALEAAWREQAKGQKPLVVSGVRDLHPEVVAAAERKVALPIFSQDPAGEREIKERKERPVPIGTKASNLDKIRDYKRQCEAKVQAIRGRPVLDLKAIRAALRQEKALEDEIAAVVTEHNKRVDEEVERFFAEDNEEGFKPLLLKAQAELKAKEKESAELKAALKKKFFTAESLDEILKEMGGLSGEMSPHTVLLLARRVARGDQEVLERFPRLKKNKKEFLEAADDYLAACFAEAWLKRIAQGAPKDLAGQRALVKWILDYNVSTRWETDILQYIEGIAIYPEQQAHLDAVLSLPGKEGERSGMTVHLPMGAGKTALLLPALAAERADGRHLVVVQTPAPLLQSVFANLSHTSKRAYRQRAAMLDFDRGSDCSPIALYRHYCLLKNLIAQRGYLMLTKASRDAFDAKLQELLALALAEQEAGRPLDTYAQEQIHYLGEINRLLEEAYNITDEGHEASRIRDEMRYTFGRKQTIPKTQIQDLQLFFDRFFKVKYDGTHTFFDLIQRNSNLPVPSPEELKTIMESFFRKELLPACFPDQSDEANQALLSFFFQPDDSDPERIRPFLTEQQYGRALLYRELCQNFLHYALTRRLFVHYGPAEDDDPRAQLGLAVYFKYNNVRSPNQFSHYLETAVLSIFMVYALGVDRFTFDRLIQRFHEQYQIERFRLIESGRVSEETETEKLFKTLFKVELKTVIKDSLARGRLYEAVKLNPEVITVALRDEILPHVETYDEELFKDSISHAHRYRTRILLSGTLRAHRTFDEKIDHQPVKSAVVNGLIRKNINDHARVVVQPKRSSQAYVEALMEIKQAGELSAMIDVGAHLDGVSNQEVAGYIAAKLLAQGRSEHIKFVLFCSEEGEWCALSTQHPEKALIRLSGTTEKELNEKLGPLGSYFTFFDQARSEGADIRQPPGSRAVVTVAKDTTESAYQQGCMRMRGLGDGQTLTIVVPEELAPKIQALKAEAKASVEGELQPSDVADYTFEVEVQGLIPDHRHAARFRLFNVLREDLAKRIKREPDKSKWAVYFGHFRSFFIRSQSLDAIKLFASKWKKMPLKTLLEQEAEGLFKDWERVLRAAGVSLTDEETASMRAHLARLIEQALRDSDPEVLHTRERDLGVEVQVQMESQVQMEVQSQVEAEGTNKSDDRFNHQFSNTVWVKQFLANRGSVVGDFRYSYGKAEGSPSYSCFEAYQDKLSQAFVDHDLGLSPHIYGESYYVDHDGDVEISQFYGTNTRPIGGLLFVGTEPLSVILLTPREQMALKESWHLYQPDPTGRKPNLWLREISGVPIAGEGQDDLAQRLDYQMLMEQLWFLNGNIERLMSLEEFQWLSDPESAKGKIEFYEKHISRAHIGIEGAAIQPLKDRLSNAMSLTQIMKLYRQVQDQIIKLGFTQAACERPEGLSEKQFGRYLSAMRFIWDAFAKGDTAKLSSKNWALDYSLPLPMVGLLKEYEAHLQTMQSPLSSPEFSFETLLVHREEWLYVYPGPDSKPLRFAEIAVDRLMPAEEAVASPYDAKSLLAFREELGARGGMVALSPREKLHYSLRLLGCINDKTVRVGALKRPEVFPLFAQFYEDPDLLDAFYAAYKDCPLASMDFLEAPPYAEIKEGEYYWLRLIRRASLADPLAILEDNPLTELSLPQLEFVLEQLDKITPLLPTTRQEDEKALLSDDEKREDQQALLFLLKDLSQCSDLCRQAVMDFCLSPARDTPALFPASVMADETSKNILRGFCALLNLPQPLEKLPEVKPVVVEEPARVLAVEDPHPISITKAAKAAEKQGISAVLAEPEVPKVLTAEAKREQEQVIPVPETLSAEAEESEKEREMDRWRRWCWLQIFLSALCAATATALFYVIAPEFLALVTTSVVTSHIIPLVMGISALVLLSVALYLSKQGIYGLIRPQAQQKNSAHRMSKLMDYFLSLFGLVMGLTVFTLSVFGMISFPLLPVLLTVLATITPICVGLYGLVHTLGVFHGRKGVKEVGLIDDLLVPYLERHGSSDGFRVDKSDQQRMKRPSNETSENHESGSSLRSGGSRG